MFGLHISLCKSNIVGINLDLSFVQAATSFLNSEIDTFKFNFLGIPVGINPRRKEVWMPIVSKMRRLIHGNIKIFQ